MDIRSIIRDPSSDHELEKMPIGQLKKLSEACYYIIENPTERLAQIYKEAFNGHSQKLWIQFYKLARFEKIMEIKRERNIY